MAALNDPMAKGYALRPRIRVLLGNAGSTGASQGAELPNCQATSVTSNNHFQADRFQAAFIPTQTGVGSLLWWSQQTDIPVDIQLGLLPLGAPPNATPSWTSLMQGNADKMTFALDHNMVTLEGRDLTATMIDNKNTGSYVNQSSSQIVQQLAAAHGLTAKIAPTTGTTGRFWSDGRQEASLNSGGQITTEWDLVVSLAKKEGFDAFVQGGILYFQPQTDPSTTPYIWLHSIDQKGRHIGNVSDLTCDRTLLASKGLTVKIRSWNSKQARAIEKTSATAASIGTKGKSLGTTYVVQKPDMTEDEAQSYADQTATELAKHELIITAKLPGDLILTPRVMVQLQGTGTVFDQLYNVVTVTKVISVSEGFNMHASCKNKASGAV